MKLGDKVYCQSKGRDVILLEYVDVYTYQACYVEGGIPFNVSTKDLLEYEGKSVRCVASGISNSSSVCIPQNKTEKAGMKMNVSKLFGEFGKVKNGELALTFSGQVVIRRNADEFVCYDAASEQIVNHMSLVIKEASQFLFILPVVTVAVNDVIKVKGDFYQVLSVKQNGIHAINLNKGTKSTICKETNAFGINFYYKVTSLFNGAFTGAPVVDAEGNPVVTAAPAIDPMMLMLLSKDGGSDFDEMLPLLMMGGLGGTTGAQPAINPLMFMMMGDKGGNGLKDMLPLLLATGGLGGAQPAGAINPLLMMSLLK